MAVYSLLASSSSFTFPLGGEGKDALNERVPIPCTDGDLRHPARLQWLRLLKALIGLPNHIHNNNAH
jgi:hypothetical protein